MDEIIITIKGILWALGAITVVGGASVVIARWFLPFKNLQKKVRNIEEELGNLKNYQNGDHSALKKLEEGNEKICKCVLAITDHELTGNSVDKLRAAKDEMQDYLITK